MTAVHSVHAPPITPITTPLSPLARHKVHTSRRPHYVHDPCLEVVRPSDKDAVLVLWLLRWLRRPKSEAQTLTHEGSMDQFGVVLEISCLRVRGSSAAWLRSVNGHVCWKTNWQGSCHVVLAIAKTSSWSMWHYTLHLNKPVTRHNPPQVRIPRSVARPDKTHRITHRRLES